MESVFKRLDELEILPNISGVSGSSKNDSTLVEELNTIISNGYADVPFENHSPQMEDVSSDAVVIEREEAERDVDQPEETPPSENQEALEKLNKEIRPEPSKLPTTPTNKTGAVLVEYTHYAGPACHDPRVTSQAQIADDLLNIVKAEGPVQVKRVFDIYLRSCGIKRMGHELRDSLLTAVGSLKGSSALSFHKYKVDDDALSEVVWIQGTEAEIVRKRGDRSLEEIPFGELYSIIQSVAASKKVDVGSEEHLRAILEVLDLKRLTSNADGILRQAIAGNFVKNAEA